MVLPAYGNSISFSQLQEEYGGTYPISMSEYCNGNGLVNDTEVPAYGLALNMGLFQGRSKAGSPSGGLINTYTGYKSHTFLSNNTFITPSNLMVDVFLVGGGAGGGFDYGSGGGAGGVVVASNISLPAGSYSVTIGKGSSGVPRSSYTSPAANGGDTIFHTYTAVGGGGGIGRTAGSARGKDGGCGGGGARDYSSPGLSTQSNQGYGVGYAGGNAATSGSFGAGGGGGAGGTGVNGTATKGGDGGPGVLNDFSTGSNQWYAGGGGGSLNGSSHGAGGSGVGGRGGYSSAISAVANTGSGGGGLCWTTSTSAVAGSGSDGIVVIRYAV